ncbi:MAG: iron-containing alcohol dehydrogenase [Anaerolineae bacterium]|nr:iron-containing alcohol dehydrogenase [Anaerolineae bacterium]
MVKFEFYTAGRIIYGRGEFDRIGDLVAGFGHKAMIVLGGEFLRTSGIVDRLAENLDAHKVGRTYYLVKGEPQISTIDEALDEARSAGCDVVIGIGGGSAIDTAKAVAGLLTNGGSALDYMEVIGAGKPLTKPAMPMIAVPTTAGTGAEVTRNAVIGYKEKHFKASMRSFYLIPRVALVDPALTHTMPPEVTASTGLDALTQVIEPYVSNHAQPLTDGLALTGIRLAARSLRQAYENGDDENARDEMSLAALMGGICLANAGLGAVHGFAAPLGAAFPIPHGVVCAALLPHVMAANVAALRKDDPNSPVLTRYADVGQALLGYRMATEDATIDAGIEFVTNLVRDLHIPKLSEFGMTEADIPDLVERAKRASSMRYNPVRLSDEALADILRKAL